MDFKVGDKVRVVELLDDWDDMADWIIENYKCEDDFIGEEGVVTQVDDGEYNCYPIKVEFSIGDCDFKLEELELAIDVKNRKLFNSLIKEV